MSLQQVGTSLTQFLVGAITAVISLTLVGVITGALLIRLLNIDPVPFQIDLARIISGGRVVSFEEAVPARLGDDLAVQRIDRVDTDGDEFKEWLVFYKAVGESGRAPTLGAIYDSDRGNPPVIFPYLLRAPDRDFLSEGPVSFQQVEVTNIFNNNIPELLIWGTNELTIFRFNPNSADWDFPRDQWPRYEVIGFFRGSDGVQFDEVTKNVTVTDRTTFERSQLAVKTVYGLNATTGAYLQIGDSPTAATPDSPISTTIDFAFGPPPDIFDTAYPEKIVLGFFKALADPNLWNPADFVAPNSQAAIELSRNFLPYFGFANDVQDISSISVTGLSYFPAVEHESARETVLGEIPQRGVVQIAFIATLPNNETRFSTVTGQPPARPDTISFEVVVLEGRWKIDRRVNVEAGAIAPSSISCSQPEVKISLGKAPIINRTVTLDGSRTSTACGIKEFRWTFGDGGAATGSAVTHQYTAPGVYQVTLTVVDNNNRSSAQTISVTIP